MRALQVLAAVVMSLAASLVHGLYQNGSVFAPCDSPLYCQGGVLEQIELARPFDDSKTFVDLPTTRPLDEVLAAFGNLSKPVSNNSELHNFLNSYFGAAGSELENVVVETLRTDPVFLNEIEDTVIKQFVEKVIDIWPDLTRTYHGAGNCTGCVNSFIPVNRTFVVAGGRFREPYYWDSYWIIEGLLRTGGSFTKIAKNIIENFLDLVDQIGFVPNGARVYYLNRSQPPLLAQMVKIFVDYTNDTSILDRAVPLLVKEHDFWMENRTVDVTTDGVTYSLNNYGVQNTQPRPESFREDYNMANNKSYFAKSGVIYPEKKPLNDSEKAQLYANLASGAESGWDYSSRWLANPSDAANDVYFPLRSLSNKAIVSVDLNSILYANEVTIAGYLNATGNETGAKQFWTMAEKRAEAMYNVMWNETYNSYFDYNLTSQSQELFTPVDNDTTPAQRDDAPDGYQVLFHTGQYYPFWLGAAPRYLKENPLAVKLAYQRVADLLTQKAGAIAATNIRTGQQWDQPNVWPPLIQILMEGLLNTPPTFGEDDPSYLETQDLALRLAQRYLDSTFCTWRATGGSTNEMPKLQGLNPAATGIMFEKYSDDSINAAGGGGEYEVVEGFGWTNGVLIWVVDTFNTRLKRPNCGDMTVTRSTGFKPSVMKLHPFDAKWTKKFSKQV